MSNVYVIDTGSREYYTVAADEYEAAEKVIALGEGFNYVEFFSDDLTDLPDDDSVVVE
jgi:hypothetical protein